MKGNRGLWIIIIGFGLGSYKGALFKEVIINETSYDTFLVKEILSLYSDTLYEGEPIDFKVWIVNKGEKEIKVSAHFIHLDELFQALQVIILIKNEKGKIEEIGHYVDILRAQPIPMYAIPPGDSVYYKFSRYVKLPPGKYWVKFKKGLFGKKGISERWIPFFVKKHPIKKEKEIALPLIQSRLGRGWHPLYYKILLKKS